MDVEAPQHSQVFIDLPNLINTETRQQLLQVEALVRHIEQFGIGRTRASYFGVYTMPTHSSVVRQMEAAFKDIDSNAIQIRRVERKPDVDSLIVNSIWYEAIRAVGERNTSIRHIIVSGDADYYDTYRSLESLLGKSLSIELIIFSWKDRCSSLWESQADRVHYLDDIPGLMPAPA